MNIQESSYTEKIKVTLRMYACMCILVLMLQVYSVCMYVLVLMLQVYSVCMYVLVLILQVYSVCMYIHVCAGAYATGI